jgi:phosphoribosylaminoimidazolecarboxamide formyltransferase/IMP cyclohydrolase
MMTKIRRALISVTDKSGVVEFASDLARYEVEILSTGGTAKAMRQGGVAVTDVAEFTGFPEMLDGRVKTLHPRVHAGILHRRDDPGHLAQMNEHGLLPIDLVAVNLYAFEDTVAKPGCSLEDAIENIDIGGPTLLRASAKNYASVTVIVDPADYKAVTDEMKVSGGSTSLATRFRLAKKVFALTSRYDAAITAYLADK